MSISPFIFSQGSSGGGEYTGPKPVTFTVTGDAVVGKQLVPHVENGNAMILWEKKSGDEAWEACHTGIGPYTLQDADGGCKIRAWVYGYNYDTTTEDVAYTVPSKMERPVASVADSPATAVFEFPLPEFWGGGTPEMIEIHTSLNENHFMPPPYNDPVLAGVPSEPGVPVMAMVRAKTNIGWGEYSEYSNEVIPT